MSRPRVIIADPDIHYAAPLVQKFINELFEKIDLELITSPEYFKRLFQSPQKAAMLIADESLYDPEIAKHPIDKVFWLCEDKEFLRMPSKTMEAIDKFVSVQEIFREIRTKSPELQTDSHAGKFRSKVIAFASGGSGSGKTTMAIGMAAAFQKCSQRVLYMQASQLQSFGYLFEDETPIDESALETLKNDPEQRDYGRLKRQIRKEGFDYLPPLKGPLFTLSVPVGSYGEFARHLQETGEYDVIVIDTDSAFGEPLMELIENADYVILMTTQSEASVHSLRKLLEVLPDVRKDKYRLFCSRYSIMKPNALEKLQDAIPLPVSGYFDENLEIERMSPSQLAALEGIQNAVRFYL